jgi:hypothetical protein
VLSEGGQRSRTDGLGVSDYRLSSNNRPDISVVRAAQNGRLIILYQRFFYSNQKRMVDKHVFVSFKFNCFHFILFYFVL